MSVKIKLRRNSSSNWQTLNPILEAGELVIDQTNNSLKVGNGSSNWNNLPYLISQGDAGYDGVANYIPGSIVYSASTLPSSEWLQCDGSTVLASSIPNLEQKLPIPIGFSGGVGAEYGTAAANGVVVTASSTLSGQSDSSQAGVDNLTDAKGDYNYDYPVWHSEQTSPLSNIWVAYTFAAPVVIDTYYMTARSSSWIPTEWGFQGSNDGTNWVEIEHRWGPQPYSSMVSSGLSTSAMSAYYTTNTTAYSAYRLQFYNNSSGWGYIALSELAMTGQATPSEPNKRKLPLIASKVYDGLTFYAFIKK